MLSSSLRCRWAKSNISYTTKPVIVLFHCWHLQSTATICPLLQCFTLKLHRSSDSSSVTAATADILLQTPTHCCTATHQGWACACRTAVPTQQASDLNCVASSDGQSVQDPKPNTLTKAGHAHAGQQRVCLATRAVQRQRRLQRVAVCAASKDVILQQISASAHHSRPARRCCCCCCWLRCAAAGLGCRLAGTAAAAASTCVAAAAAAAASCS